MSALLIRFTKAHGCPVYLSPDGQVLQANPHPDAQIVRNTPAVFVLNSPEAATSPRCPTSCLAPLQKKPSFHNFPMTNMLGLTERLTHSPEYVLPFAHFLGMTFGKESLKKASFRNSAWGVIELRTFHPDPRHNHHGILQHIPCHPCHLSNGSVQRFRLDISCSEAFGPR